MPSATPQAIDLIPPIRHASRQLVREWGFMRPTLAGTSLSGIAVHCLIEIGDHAVKTIPELCHILRVNKTEAKRAVQELVATEQISVEWKGDGGMKEQILAVTSRGQDTLAAVNAHASSQVQKALEYIPPDAADKVMGGLQLYAEALQSFRESITQEIEGDNAKGIQIIAGYRPGILGRMLEMHMDYYYKTVQWGASFETSLAADMSSLIQRLDRPLNEAWSAVETLPNGEQRIMGTIFIDGEDATKPGLAHVRCFIVDEHIRGSGVGRRLFTAAMDFVRARAFEEATLWTMASLLAACRLYEEAGFVMVAETEVVKWEQTATLRQYSWKAPGLVRRERDQC